MSSPAVPRVVAVSPQMRLVEDNPSSLSLVEIYKQRCAKKGIEHDNPISRYYDRLATVQARGTQASHQVQRQSVQPTNMLHWYIHLFLFCFNTGKWGGRSSYIHLHWLFNVGTKHILSWRLLPVSLLCALGLAGHPKGGAGKHGAPKHAEGMGSSHVPQCHWLLDLS